MPLGHPVERNEPDGGRGASGPDRQPPGPEPSPGFAALLARHHTTLLGYVLSMVPSFPDAEDIVQETSAVLWRKFAEFEPGSNFLAWACQVARFHVMNHLRKRARDRHVLSQAVVEVMGREAEAEAGRLEAERAALEGCLSKLDADTRDLVRRCYAAGVTVKSVADERGATPNSIYKALNRAREALLRCIRRVLAAGGEI